MLKARNSHTTTPAAAPPETRSAAAGTVILLRPPGADPRAAPDPHAVPLAGPAQRRQLLGDFAALLLLAPTEAGASKAAELDGELLDCCQAVRAIDRQADATLAAIAGIPASDRRWEAAAGEALTLLRQHRDAVTEAARRVARTPEGLRAKAALALSLGAGDGGHALALSLALDVAGRAA